MVGNPGLFDSGLKVFPLSPELELIDEVLL